MKVKGGMMRRMTVLTIALVMLATFLPNGGLLNAGAINPVLTISPQMDMVPVGSSVIVEVRLVDAPFSYGLSCQIEYDTQSIEIDQDNIIEGEYYRQDGDETVFTKYVDDSKNVGRLNIGVTRFRESGPIAGSSIVFYFEAKCKFVGEAALVFGNAHIMDIRYQQGEAFFEEVPCRVEEGFVNCVAKDNEPPKVNIVKTPPPETNNHIGEYEWNATDDSTPPDRIQFSYKLEDPIAGGKWSNWEYRTEAAVTFLREGKNCFYVKARDERGNQSNPVFVCNQFDITGPKLELQPIPNEVYDQTLEICGLTDLPETGITLLMNGVMVPLNSDGQFCKTQHLYPGTNTIHVSATDRAGNMKQEYFTTNYVIKTVVEMWINNSNVLISGKNRVCDPAPLIISGRTMVPMRFISEAFGMDVDWIADSKQVNVTWTETVAGQKFSHKLMMWIGKKTYNIDGRTDVMDVPPQIVQSRTMVPLRFIGEAFGAEFKWDGNERKVTFEYVNR